MSVRCPNGHTSEATDYCDVCGAPIAPGAGGAGGAGGVGAGGRAGAGGGVGGPAGAGAVVCPNGHTSVSTDYCDTCGTPIGAGAAGAGAGGPSAGAPPAPPTATVASVPGGTRFCPNCGTENAGDALFCEGCGYDFTTGAKPRATAAPPPDAGGSLDLSGLPVTEPGSAVSGAGGSGAGGSGAGASAAGGGPAATVVMPTTPPATPPPTPPTTPSPDSGPPVAPAVPLEWVVERWVDPGWYDLQDSQDPCPSPGLPVVVPLTVRSVLVGRVSFNRNIHPTIDCSPDIGVSRRHCQLTTDGSRWWVEDLQSSNGTYVGPDSGPLPTKALVPGTRRELEESDRIYLGAWTRLVVRRATEEEKAGGV